MPGFSKSGNDPLDKPVKIGYHRVTAKNYATLNSFTAKHLALPNFGLFGQDGVVDRVGGALRPVVVLS